MCSDESIFNPFYFKRHNESFQVQNESNLKNEKSRRDSDNTDNEDDFFKSFFVPYFEPLDLSNYNDLIDELKIMHPVNFMKLHKRYDKIIYFLKFQTFDYWNSDVIQLPNISLAKIDQNRFKFDQENFFIKMVNRKYIVNDYLEFIKKNQTLYIYGLKGVGKSFIIYQMVAKLMTMDEKYRIIYVNQCDANIIQSTFEIVRTIVWSDYCKNEIMKKELNKFIQSSIYKEYDKSFELSNFDSNINYTIITAIANQYKNLGIELIFVYDQVNLILRDSKLTNQYSFLSNMVLTHKTILSASANNQLNFFQLKVNYNVTPPVKLSFDEFKSFLSFYPLAAIQHIKTSGDADQVMSLTGGVPLELNRFFSVNDAQNLENMIDKYVFNFNDDKNIDNFSSYSIEKWYEGLKKEWERSIAIDNISKCVLNLPIEPINQAYYDKRIFVPEVLNEIEIYLRPFSSLVMSNAMNFYNHLIKNQLIMDFEFIISRSAIYDQATIGKSVEKFIIHSLSANIQETNQSQVKIKFPVHILNYERKTESLTDHKQYIIFEDYEVVHFGGLTVPTIKKGLNRNIIFVPQDSCYPGFDFFYFQSSNYSANNQNNLFCFQITIENNPIEHIIYTKKDDRSETSNQSQIKSESVEIENSKKQKLPSEKRKKKSKLLETVDDWNNYFNNQVNLIEVLILRMECLVDQKYKELGSDRLNYLNVVDFKEIEDFKSLAAYFKKLC